MIATAPVGSSTLSQLSADGAAAKKIPWTPSERDFEVYRQTAVEGRTTREVAAEFNLSQTRVVQLRDKVLEWIGRHLPPLAKLTPAERLRVAQTLACQQLQHQYDEAMQAWRKSATAVHVTRYVGRAIEDGLTLVKESQGDPRYLRLANQITKSIARQEMMTMPDPETAVPIELIIVDREETAVLTDAPIHPEGDCSNSTSLPIADPAPSTTIDTATPVRAAVSDARSAPKAPPLMLGDDVSQTVQAIVDQLENIPDKQRRQLRREQQIRRELFGETPAGSNLLAQLTENAEP